MKSVLKLVRGSCQFSWLVRFLRYRISWSCVCASLGLNNQASSTAVRYAGHWDSVSTIYASEQYLADAAFDTDPEAVSQNSRVAEHDMSAVRPLGVYSDRVADHPLRTHWDCLVVVLTADCRWFRLQSLQSHVVICERVGRRTQRSCSTPGLVSTGMGDCFSMSPATQANSAPNIQWDGK